MFQQQHDESLHISYVNSAAGAAAGTSMLASVPADATPPLATVTAEEEDDETGDVGEKVFVCAVAKGAWLVAAPSSAAHNGCVAAATVAADDSLILQTVPAALLLLVFEFVAVDDDDGGGVLGGNGESVTLTRVAVAEVLRVRNQQSIGVGLPFITTGPRYSRLNESSWLISWQSNR